MSFPRNCFARQQLFGLNAFKKIKNNNSPAGLFRRLPSSSTRRGDFCRAHFANPVNTIRARRRAAMRFANVAIFMILFHLTLYRILSNIIIKLFWIQQDQINSIALYRRVFFCTLICFNYTSLYAFSAQNDAAKTFAFIRNVLRDTSNVLDSFCFFLSLQFLAKFAFFFFVVDQI